MEEPTEETQEEDAAGPESLEEVDVEGEEEAEPEEMEGMLFLLLGFRQRLVQLFQLQCFQDIPPFPKPKNHKLLW